MRGSSGADRLLGAVGGAMVLAAVVLFFFGGDGDTGGAAGAGAPVPSLTLVTPVHGATVGTPLDLHFRSEEEISPRAGGWGTESLHLHLSLDGREFMPGAGDLRRDAAGYRWTVPGVPAGEHTVQLYWADLDHQRLEEGATPPVLIRVE